MTVWIESKNRGGRHSTDAPCPTMMAAGMGDDSYGHWSLRDDGMPAKPDDGSKPAYRVPSMAEVAVVRPNGFSVASTFSGCGGSCLGYRMAGFRVAWASEFVPIAQDSYRANASPDSILDGRDVRTVQAQEILDAVGMQPGELDLLDGSPPCQAFSTAGKRAKGWGTEREYDHGAKQRNEELFFEYVRLLQGTKPKCFVAENVSGLVKGVAKGFFLEILAALKGCGYRVEARVLDAQWLGVPQCRQRVIFVGAREDLCAAHGVGPAFPKPLPYRYSVREACPWIGSAVHDTSGKMGAGVNSFSAGEVAGRPCPAITVGVGGLNSRHFADGEVPLLPFASVVHENGGFSRTECLDRPMPAVTATQCRVSVADAALPKELVLDESRRKACDGIRVFGAVNPADADEPCPTVQTVSHDTPLRTERRKFTIAELRRICSFPDDFVLVGSYAEQWARLGNSVPPLMMRAIAEVVRDRILAPCLG